LECVTGSTAGQHGLGQRDPQRLLDLGRKTRHQHLACPGLGVGEPARRGKQGNQFCSDRIPCRVGWLLQLRGPLKQPHGNGGSAARGLLSGPSKPVEGLLVAGSGPHRHMRGHQTRWGFRSRQGTTRLEVEGPTYGDWKIRVHGLTDQFVMKRQLLAGLAEHASPNGLLDVVHQRRARPIEDRGEFGQREGGTKDRGDAEHRDGLGGKGLQLAKDEQSERRRKDELAEFRSTLTNLDHSFVRQGTQQFRHIQRVTSSALDRLQERRAGGCSHDLRDEGGDRLGRYAPQAKMQSPVGNELTQQPIQLRAGGRGSEGPYQGEREVSEASAQLAKDQQGGWVRPLKILYRNDRRGRQGEALHQRQHGFQDSEPKRRRLGKRPGGASDRVAVPDEQMADLRSVWIRRGGVKVEGLDQCAEGPVSLQFCRHSDVGLAPEVSSALQGFGHEPALPDPGLALDEGDLAGALGCPAEQLVQGVQLRGAARKGQGSRRRGRHWRRSQVDVSLGGDSCRTRCFTTASPAGAD
jgi:hypothetical protein